ncbi:hypothetical protein CASFOL_003799 [Castilleja foliolosa]|uniref:Uncharacterized protein n=1 Tax=Castilleja foliolosa TaxID=1961234 RepID=A0ABD3EI80_9LAMI
MLNLPKKKNIHKDLRLSFQCVCGILNIVPVVSGNEKTRDPVCKVSCRYFQVKSR